MIKHRIDIRVLLFQENNIWVAQCLEYDFATQGDTTQEALDALERIFLGQVAIDIIKTEINPLLQDIEKAPDYYFQTFENALCLKELRIFEFVWKNLQSMIEVFITDIRIVV